MRDAVRRISHSIAFSALRRAEMGRRHHISGKYLGACAREKAWREDTSAGRTARCTASWRWRRSAVRVSRVWAGYWQRTR